MTDDFWARVRATFEAAADAAPETVADVLDAVSAGDADVRREAVVREGGCLGSVGNHDGIVTPG